MPRANRGYLIGALSMVALSCPALADGSDAQRNTVMRMRQRLIEIYRADVEKCQADDQGACKEAKTLYGSLKDIDAQIVDLGWDKS